jgi:hypothetical protein
MPVGQRRVKPPENFSAYAAKYWSCVLLFLSRNDQKKRDISRSQLSRLERCGQYFFGVLPAPIDGENFGFKERIDIFLVQEQFGGIRL